MVPEIKIKVTIGSSERKFKISAPSEAADVFRTLFNNDTIQWVEESVMLCMNRNMEVVGYYRISSGGTTATIVDPKVIFTIALNSGASSIMLAHNHPSGNLTPSDMDIQITEKLVKAGELLDIKVMDHLIITADGFLSMNQEGII